MPFFPSCRRYPDQLRVVLLVTLFIDRVCGGSCIDVERIRALIYLAAAIVEVDPISNLDRGVCNTDRRSKFENRVASFDSGNSDLVPQSNRLPHGHSRTS